jgi:hypothetical protein
MTSRINPITKQCCLDIIDSLISHPISAAFLDSPDVSEIPKDFDTKKQSTSLLAAKEKLLNNKYMTFSQWEKDMKQIFILFEKINSDNEVFTILTNEMEHLFAKYEEKFLRNKVPKWINVVLKFDKKLDESFNTPPPIIIAHTPMDKNDPSLEKPFSEDEMNNFVKFSKYLTSEEDNRAIISIIKGHQPDIKFNEKHSVIDVSDLTHDTMFALRKFFTARLARMNIVYPH